MPLGKVVALELEIFVIRLANQILDVEGKISLLPSNCRRVVFEILVMYP